MEPFITFKEKDADGKDQFFVLQRKFPHYQAMILEYPREGTIATVPVPGHSFYLNFCGTIEGNYLLAKTGVEQEIQATLERMADWFYKNMIVPEPKRYKRFKI